MKYTDPKRRNGIKLQKFVPYTGNNSKATDILFTILIITFSRQSTIGVLTVIQTPEWQTTYIHLRYYGKNQLIKVTINTTNKTTQ